MKFLCKHKWNFEGNVESLQFYAYHCEKCGKDKIIKDSYKARKFEIKLNKSDRLGYSHFHFNDVE